MVEPRVERLAGPRVSGPVVYGFDGCELRGRQAARRVQNALSTGQSVDVEIAFQRVFDKSIYHAVDGITFGQHGGLYESQKFLGYERSVGSSSLPIPEKR